jgi:hypothetical protein
MSLFTGAPFFAVSRVVGRQEGEHIRATDWACSARSWPAALGCLTVRVLNRPFGFAAHAVAADLYFNILSDFGRVGGYVGAL